MAKFPFQSLLMISVLELGFYILKREQTLFRVIFNPLQLTKQFQTTEAFSTIIFCFLIAALRIKRIHFIIMSSIAILVKS
jgi:hypothetical protein